MASHSYQAAFSTSSVQQAEAYPRHMIPGLVESCVGTIILTAIIEKQAIVMSKMEVAYGLGTLFMPLLSDFLISNNVWAFLVLGLISFLVMLVWSRMSFGSLDDLLIRQTDTSGNGKQAPISFSKTWLTVYFFSSYVLLFMEPVKYRLFTLSLLSSLRNGRFLTP